MTNLKNLFAEPWSSRALHVAYGVPGLLGGYAYALILGPWIGLAAITVMIIYLVFRPLSNWSTENILRKRIDFTLDYTEKILDLEGLDPTLRRVMQTVKASLQ